MTQFYLLMNYRKIRLDLHTIKTTFSLTYTKQKNKLYQDSKSTIFASGYIHKLTFTEHKNVPFQNPLIIIIILVTPLCSEQSVI